jgi:hypothetical protein
VIVDDQHSSTHADRALIRIDDDGADRGVDCLVMEPSATSSPLVVVDLRPHLLADAVARLLASDGAEVLVLGDDQDPQVLLDLRPAIAIGSDDRPTTIAASVVMRLAGPGDGGPDLATIRRVVRLLGAPGTVDDG